jgi:hypothetical protein
VRGSRSFVMRKRESRLKVLDVQSNLLCIYTSRLLLLSFAELDYASLGYIRIEGPGAETLT